jgi:hypothetical protein
MIQVPFLSLPIDAAPRVPNVTVPDPVVILPMPTMSEGSEYVLQEPPEPIVEHEEEEEQLCVMCKAQKASC